MWEKEKTLVDLHIQITNILHNVCKLTSQTMIDLYFVIIILKNFIYKKKVLLFI